MYPSGVWDFQVKLAIRRYGKEYTFEAPKSKDQFGQPAKAENPFIGKEGYIEPAGGIPTSQFKVNGIYHEDHRWTQSIVSEEQSSNVNRNPTESYILVKKEDVKDLKWGMTVVVVDKTYRLIKSRDIEGMGLFCDLVLQEVEPSGLSDRLQ